MYLELQQWSFALLDSRGWVGIIFGVVFSSAIAYTLYNYGISKLEAQEVGIFTYIDPVIAVLLAIPLLQRIPHPLFLCRYTPCIPWYHHCGGKVALAPFP